MIKKPYIIVFLILIISLLILMILKHNNKENIPEDEQWMYEPTTDSEGEPTTTWDGTIDESEYSNPYDTAEERQDTVDNISEISVEDAIEYENALIVKNRSDIDYTGITSDILPEKTREQLMFGYADEEILLTCYAVAQEYLGTINEFELSDWLTSIFYTDSDAMIEILLINGEHYKFVMTDTKVFMTTHI